MSQGFRTRAAMCHVNIGRDYKGDFGKQQHALRELRHMQGTPAVALEQDQSKPLRCAAVERTVNFLRKWFA